MKGNYIKPMLAIEFFSGQSVARDCGDSIPKDQLNFNEPGQCVWDLGGDSKVFVDPPKCTINGEAMEIACYNNPSEGNYVFRS